MGMKFLSVCSGIEAASVAWKPLGWKAVGFSEIEPFPCAVLAHHYPGVPNFGDVNSIYLDTAAKVLFSVAHGEQAQRVSGSDPDVRQWPVCGGCGGVLWRHAASDV